MSKELESKLTVGTSIKLGKDYCKHTPKDAGKIITLVNGYFEYDNGLYDETHEAPSVWNNKLKEFDSIYHMFGNDLSGFRDCEIVATQSQDLQPNEQNKL